MPKAGTGNIETDMGSAWAPTITYKDSNGDGIDLTGATVRMKIKTKFGGTELFSLDSGTGNGITWVDRANGQFKPKLTNAQTAGVTSYSNVYDIEVEDSSGDVTRIAQGAFTFRREVTDE